MCLRGFRLLQRLFTFVVLVWSLPSFSTTQGQRNIGTHSPKARHIYRRSQLGNMTGSYAVRDSPGKGRGVFATKVITPGTTIMSDQAIIKINKVPPSITAPDVADALQKLNKAD